MGARDDTDYQQHEEGDEFHSARDLSDFARLHQQAAASTAAGPSSSGQNGASHEAGSSDSQPGESWAHVSDGAVWALSSGMGQRKNACGAGSFNSQPGESWAHVSGGSRARCQMAL